MRAKMGGTAPTAGGTWTVINVGNPLLLDLTVDFLAENFFSPLIAGDSLVWRFQCRNELDQAVNLAGSTITFKIFDALTSTAVLFSAPVTLDADQTAETGDTGKGWYGVAFAPADLAALQTAVGRKFYQGVITFGNGIVRTHTQGRVDVLRKH